MDAADISPEVIERRIAERIAEAKKAWRRIQKNASKLWDDWVLIGDALDDGRTEALYQSGANEPKGQKYNRAFKTWLEDNGFKDIHQSTRAYLLRIMDEEAEVERWREQLSEDNQYRWNHPIIVWKQFQAYKRREGQHDDKPPRRPGLREENVRLQEENDRLNQQIEALQIEINQGGLAERETIAASISAVDVRFQNDDLVEYIDGLITVAHERGVTKSWGRRRPVVPDSEA